VVATRVAVIVGIAAATYLLRVVPQLIAAVQNFPAAADRYLKYLAYALVVSTISISLFIAGGRFDAPAAPRRLVALAIAVAVAAITRNALAGMLTGTAIALLLSWIAAS
jgi:branched-subunit amino acid transport protein